MDAQPLLANPHIIALCAAIREACGGDDQAFLDTLDGESDAVEAARAAMRFINECDANEEAMKQLAHGYDRRAKVFADRVGRTRAAIAHFMSEIGERKLALPEATISLVAGGSSLVGDPDASLLPDDLVRTKREADRTAIKAALEGGREIPGCSLSNAPPRLSIRIR